MADADIAALAAAYPRCVVLDGTAGRPWSGDRSVVAGLGEDDVSLTWDATTGEVRRWTGRPGAWRGVVVGDDVFAVLEREVAAAPGARWFGWLGYGARRDLPARRDASDAPDAVWMRPSRLRHFGGQSVTFPGRPGNVSLSASNSMVKATLSPVDRGKCQPPTWYRTAFTQVQEALHAGESYEVNLTHRAEAATTAAPAAVYAALRAATPAPYAAFLQHDVTGGADAESARGWLLAASPERYARIAPTADGRARRIETKPMKGTAPRGATPAEDAALRDALTTDEKIRAENLMIVDLLRNDVSTVSRPGSVVVPELMVTETYAAVHQLVSTVVGELRPEVTTVEAVRALFPAGSMTGAPKHRTMQVIEAVESSARGVYAGAFGWLDGSGADLGVVIRSLASSDGRAWRAGTGGGITVRSTVEDEWAEAGWKLERVLAAVAASTPAGSPTRPAPAAPPAAPAGS
ncbi:anthranilate synthase component I family protein [Nocardioides zeae]|uniref:Anthranilate synthase component I family protein n=2 Tax=Nocardioides zeae TaxID=1457234 RepID=A0A6P0HMA4_9ACTN|nr:anthranilate synthase component I family protein [Nocardioides zeae]NEN79849.1 anthranilate synthase component I family protein [Nocardioides zeae]